MRTGRPKRPLTLTADEEAQLQSLAHRARTQPALARRARVILGSAEGLANNVVARQVRCSPGMVNKWRSRFLKSRLEGLYDEPRPGAPRQVSDAQVEQVVIRTLESTPRAQTHWSTRGMAQAAGLSRMTISRIWQAFGLQPHRTETFKLSPDPLLIEKVRDIVGLYMNPPNHALVFCVDEKSQIQALDRTQPMRGEMRYEVSWVAPDLGLFRVETCDLPAATWQSAYGGDCQAGCRHCRWRTGSVVI